MPTTITGGFKMRKGEEIPDELKKFVKLPFKSKMNNATVETKVFAEEKKV